MGYFLTESDDYSLHQLILNPYNFVGTLYRSGGERGRPEVASSHPSGAPWPTTGYFSTCKVGPEFLQSLRPCVRACVRPSVCNAFLA